ncbi:MAG: type II secretion system protein GspK [Wenzhouxiangella sp.]|jgi:general secretion pathway protein K|nr:type II secretion system protein GspK [Wenzhouxiangella sp.]MDR9452555.1 type II secretion system protein GspK [Wenzhouxiangella sp.]
MISPACPRHGERGVALLVVLWLLILLTIVVGVYAVLTRTEAMQARFVLDATRARYAAEAGLHRAAYEMANPDLESKWVGDGRPYTIEFGEASVEIRITDESGKIDLNRVSAELLTELFFQQGVDEMAALRLADAVIDWRDGDDAPGEYGAEIAEYDAAGYPYGPANRAFQTVDEIQQVMGMTQEMFANIRDLVTVSGGSGQPSPAFAPAEVLALLPDMDRATAEAFVTERRGYHPSEEVGLMMANGELVDLRQVGRTFSVHAKATLDSGTWASVQATVSMGRGMRGRPFQILQWRENVTE